MKYITEITTLLATTAIAAATNLFDVETSTEAVSQERRRLGKKNSKKAKCAKNSKRYKSGKCKQCSRDNEYPTLDLSEPFQPLRKPHQVDPDEDGVTRLTLNYDIVNYKGPSFDTVLRLHNEEGFPPTGPGPTVHVQPGGRLEINLVNCLQYPLGSHGNGTHNTFKTPNTTNIHTHGPHISGNIPGDSIFVETNPRIDQDTPGDDSTHQYEYVFGDNHMPGTFWYHPHFHGSTALQVGQGAAGLLIMDDPDDYDIPQEIKDMPEIQMVLQHMDLGELRRSSSTSQDHVTNWGDPNSDEPDLNFETTNVTTDLTNIILVNMQFLPKVTMELGKWYRWRLVMSSLRDSLAFESMSENCEFQLLAKDGIYLSDAPRKVPVIILSSGNRADVAVRCNKLGQELMNTTKVDINVFDPGTQYATAQEEGPFVHDLVGTFHDPQLQPAIMVIDVVTGDPLPPLTSPTPCYLVDLRDVSDTEIATHFKNRYDFFDNNDTAFVYGPYGVGASGEDSDRFPWKDENTYINDFATGTVNEIELQLAKSHPYHQHVNSFQIQEIYDIDFGSDAPKGPVVLDDRVGVWFQVGDWHDVLMLPAPTENATVRIRFQADDFIGHMLQHCHILMHEDLGMMAQYNVTGMEGAHWTGAHDIDPNCTVKGEESSGQ